MLVSPATKSGIAFSRSISPGQSKLPSPIVPCSGPSADIAFPVDKTIPSVKGKFSPLLEKYAIPLVEPKSDPVEVKILDTSAHGESIRTSSTNSVVVKVVSSTSI